MSGRHSGLSSVSVAALPFLALLVGACAASTTNAEHGPAFGDDAGDGAASDSAPGDDATTDTGPSPDTSSPQDSSTASDTGSATDGPAAGEAGTDASDSGSPGSDGGGCTSTMALLAMGASGLAEARFSGGTWSAAATVGTGGAAPPALPGLVPFSGGFLGAFVSGGGQLDGTGYTSAWSAPAQIGSKTAQGTPALTVTGSTAHVVYWGGVGDGKYYLGSYSGTWDSASDPVEADGGTQSFGSSGPAAAGVGSSVVVVQSGSNGTLYDQIWSGGAWQPAAAHAGTAVVPTISPAVVALQGGAADVLAVYVRSGGDNHLDYTTRTGTTWSAAAEVYDVNGNIAYTGFTPSLAALPGGSAIVVWQGGNNMPYASTYVPGTGWTAPSQIASATVVSAPVVAQGVCGASAIVAFVQTGGQVQAASLAGTTWSAPAAISGATGMQSVAIATSP